MLSSLVWYSAQIWSDHLIWSLKLLHMIFPNSIMKYQLFTLCLILVLPVCKSYLTHRLIHLRYCWTDITSLLGRGMPLPYLIHASFSTVSGFFFLLSLYSIIACERRGLREFRQMVECKLPERDPLLDFWDYGCYCGLGGQGTPVDDLDRSRVCVCVSVTSITCAPGCWREKILAWTQFLPLWMMWHHIIMLWTQKVFCLYLQDTDVWNGA